LSKKICQYFFCHNDDKYVSHVFLCLLVILCINEKYIYGFQIVVDEAPQRLRFQSLGVCVDSIVLTGFVQRRRCLVELWC